jgi:hypothetical protein
MPEKALIKAEQIQKRIYTIRGIQVMLDIDLAELYDVDIKRLNEQVKRNIERFPGEFMFQLSADEYDLLRSQNAIIERTRSLRSQIATSNKRGGRRYLPYAFSEQGVAMLSAVLRSDTAVKMSINIMNAFIVMRRFIALNAQVFQRIETLETKQIETNRKVDKVLDAIESKGIQPKRGIYFDGQVFDAYKFISDLFRSAKKSILIIDNYIDDTVLVHLAKRAKDVSVIILTPEITKQLELDVKKFNAQYPKIEIREYKKAHDRFIVIDDAVVYLIGASLKDLGKKLFGFSKMDISAVEMLRKLAE